jgi:hypothetical protein
LALGQKIVAEFGRDSRSDTLGKWIAHDLASKILRANAARGPEKMALETDCRDTILTLWKQRAILPNGKRPFESYEPAFRALESLDPMRESDRYFTYVMEGLKTEVEKKSEAEKWLESARTIDRAARSIIRLCLVSAIDNLSGDKASWVPEAIGVLTEEDLDTKIVISFMADAQQLTSTETEKLEAVELARLRGFLESLKALLQAAARCRVYLEDRIKSLS